MTKQKITLLKLTLGLGTILGMLNVTLFNVALPTMATVFDTTIATVQWLTSGYMLAAGMIILAAGFLGNHFGYKRIFCLSLICVLLLSILGAFAWCIEALIVVRFLFGLCAGLLPPLSLAMLYQLLPASRQTEAASTWGMANMIGGVLPSCLSGFILSVASWKFLLLFNVPFALLTLCLTIYFLPNDPPKDSAKLDCSGMFLTSAGSLILLITFSNLSKWGISLKLLTGLLLGFGCFILYCIKSRNRSDVLLNLNV